MLDVMETPAHERRQIEEYLRSQSGDDFEIEHVEKLTSEYVLGRQYDVWDAHTSDGRWWVITNPVNLYSQDQIKSMDIALSFHIGLMSRMMASQPHPSARQRTWVLVPYTPDWRWLREGDTTPWYPSVKLYRQKSAGDWPELFSRVAIELRQEFPTP